MTSSHVPPSHAELARRIDALVEACRGECLWFLRPDYFPRTDSERASVLDAIQRHAGLEAYQEAARLKRWLSLASSETSAGSAAQRKQAGESHVAGGVTLNELLAGTRRSRDVDAGRIRGAFPELRPER